MKSYHYILFILLSFFPKTLMGAIDIKDLHFCLTFEYQKTRLNPSEISQKNRCLDELEKRFESLADHILELRYEIETPEFNAATRRLIRNASRNRRQKYFHRRNLHYEEIYAQLKKAKHKLADLSHDLNCASCGAREKTLESKRIEELRKKIRDLGALLASSLDETRTEAPQIIIL